MSCHPNYIRFIPPVDVPCHTPYVGCRRPASSTVPNTLGTNPRCPMTICGLCAGPNCKCNMNHMKDPFKHRYFVYKWNQY